MRIALIGQPNCGKSTLFNQVAGYRAETGNFSGTSVTYTESKVRVLGQVVSLVDLPGTYTLAGTNQAEREVFNYLALHTVDVIVNVVDASHLSHGMELTLELMELQRPVILALNMMDEARRLGIQVGIEKLEELIGIPVIPIIASRGHGIKKLFTTAVNVGLEGIRSKRLLFSQDIEQAIKKLAPELVGVGSPLHAEMLAIKLLEEDEGFTQQVVSASPNTMPLVAESLAAISSSRQQKSLWVISGERHAHAARIADQVITQQAYQRAWQDQLDDLMLHPVWGYFALIFVLYLFFQLVYAFGSLLETPLLDAFYSLEAFLEHTIGEDTFWTEMLTGLVQGVSGGIAIVLPYLMPFLLGLGLMEDIGYLPRIAFLLDALMHRLGLHGKAIVPFILGYGCNVPAIMSTRIMEDRRDRFLAAALATLVPCAARLAVVFGLVAFYLGPNLALAIYIFNLFVIALTARFLSNIMPEHSPGLIFEMPVYRLPTVKNVVSKAWFRIREFIVEAWPVLIVGSVVLSLLSYMRWDLYLNGLVYPLAWLLGLPREVGVPLVFGILRKELSLVMLRQALGGGDLGEALTSVQMITFSVFVVFYIPCMATLVVLRRELGSRSMIMIAGLTVVIATLAALIARGASVVAGL
jgi:ferrous iron transport protein B